LSASAAVSTVLVPSEKTPPGGLAHPVDAFGIADDVVVEVGLHTPALLVA